MGTNENMTEGERALAFAADHPLGRTWFNDHFATYECACGLRLEPDEKESIRQKWQNHIRALAPSAFASVERLKLDAAIAEAKYWYSDGYKLCEESEVSNAVAFVLANRAGYSQLTIFQAERIANLERQRDELDKKLREGRS